MFPRAIACMFNLRLSKYLYHCHGRGLMLGGSRGPDPLNNKKVFAGSDYLTASASSRYFNLGGNTRPREMD